LKNKRMTSMTKKIMVLEMDDWRSMLNNFFFSRFDWDLMKRKIKKKEKSTCNSCVCLMIIRLFSGVYMRGNIIIRYTSNIHKHSCEYSYTIIDLFCCSLLLLRQNLWLYTNTPSHCQQFHPINMISQLTEQKTRHYHVNFSRQCVVFRYVFEVVINRAYNPWAHTLIRFQTEFDRMKEFFYRILWVRWKIIVMIVAIT
jgi:hypothetical protein